MSDAKLHRLTAENARLSAEIALLKANWPRNTSRFPLMGKQWDEMSAEIARLTARIEELESALRLNLAVAPDDPLLLTPVERQLYACREENERLKQDSQWAHGRVDELAAEVGRLRADLATCRVALAEIATDPRDPDYHRRFHPTTVCDTCIARAALAQLTIVVMTSRPVQHVR